MSVSPGVQAQREGFATALITKLFPGMREQSGSKYRADVQLIYDWETSVSGGTRNDPLNMNKHGDYASVHEAELAAMRFVQLPNEHALYSALQSGNYGAAKKQLPFGVTVSGKTKLPSPIKSSGGGLGQSGVPSTLDEIGNTLKDLPGAAASDAGSVGSGVGSLLGNHMVLIVLVVALILVMKK